MAILFSVSPHFIFGSGINYDDVRSSAAENPSWYVKSHEACHSNDNGTDHVDCTDYNNSNKIAYALLCIGEALRGAGGSIFFALGFAYVDDNVDPAMSPIYLGEFSLSSYID